MTTRLCTIENCTRSHEGHGYCTYHNYRFKRYGNPLATTQRQVRRKEKGDPPGWLNDQGYRLLNMVGHPNSAKNGHIREHIYVMSEHLGRPLLPHENVHHKNGVRDDNRLENLELWTKSQPPGQRVSDKIRWALEILETYGNNPVVYED